MLYFIDEDPASPATVLLVLDVLRLALRLNIPRLRGLCARYLHANLGFGNVIQALHAAHHANLNCIKEVCLRYSKNLKKNNLNISVNVHTICLDMSQAFDTWFILLQIHTIVFIYLIAELVLKL